MQGPIVEPPSQTQQPPIVPPPFQYPAPPPSQPRATVSRTAILVAVVTGLVLLVGVVFIARQFIGPMRARMQIGKAIESERAGRTQEALSLYEKLVRDAPEDATVRLAYAEALRRAERYDDALEQYDEALRIDPEMEGAWVTLGIAAYEAGDLKKSADAYRKALKLDDSLTIAHNNLAYVLYDQDKVDEAVAEWEKAVDNLSEGAANRQGRADCWAGLAIGYLAQDKRGEAIRAFRRATAIDRGYLSTRYMKEEAFWSDKALDAAEELIPEVRTRPSPLSGNSLPSA